MNVSALFCAWSLFAVSATRPAPQPHRPLRDHHDFEIMDVGARADLKTEVLKDLKNMCWAYRGNPAVSM
jgi:fatty acid/phospholipid biosynthesis enzyme